MNKTDLLERWYKGFIDLSDRRDFFVGMCDYLEFADSVPEFDKITAEINAQGKALEDRLRNAEGDAISSLQRVYSEVSAYITEQGIKSGEIEDSLRNYEGWLNEKIVGSSTRPEGMFTYLNRIIYDLYTYTDPKHKPFMSKYVLFDERGTPIKYLSLKEYDSYSEIAAEIKRGRETTLWGQLSEISWYYQVIKHGRERNKQYAEEHRKTNSAKVFWEGMNHKILLEEWQSIENKESPPGSRIYFFKIEKIKPWLIRLHTHILSTYVNGPIGKKDDSNALTTIEDKKMPIAFSPRLVVEKGIGFLQITKNGLKHRIGKTSTRKFKLICCLFSTENRHDAGYNSTFQNHERIFGLIELPKDKTNGKLKSVATHDIAMQSIIEATIKEIQKIKTLQGYIHFSREADKIRLEITVPEGKK